ncbi:hypothetical protein CKO28_18550 [Rhodovibrio sodomensis]|uniref:DUF4402 domain-containing protein n=1 Tax=Rhodovibrio sodomensis TaxID=1088 RepID=A0ABS1DKK9_9PROT|nr:hypothetical protein [Rhodovibrio sodomensis]MBK1670038.1 hypothetical protein [Rhodovibrio sodomensis]
MEIRKNLLAGVAAMGMAFGAAGAANAASQGSEGTTSTGSVGVSATVSETVRISGLDDLDVGTVSALDNVVRLFDDVCVYTTSPTGFDITVESNYGNGTFEMYGSNTAHRLEYEVYFEGVAGGDVFSATTLTEGAVTSFSPGSSQFSDASCSGTGGVNASIGLQLDGTRIQASPADSYSDTLTVLVEPR